MAGSGVRPRFRQRRAPASRSGRRHPGVSASECRRWSMVSVDGGDGHDDVPSERPSNRLTALACERRHTAAGQGPRPAANNPPMAERPPVEELSPQEAMEELAALAGALAEANRAYHQADAPEISDAEYDALKRRNAAIEARFPELKRPDSPSEQVGAAPSEAFAKVRHARPLYSLENAFDEAEVPEFVERVRRFLNLPADAPLAFTAEPKIDGLSLVAALRGGPPRHRRHPRRRRDRRERDAERPHHRRHPRAALRRSRHPRGPRRVLHEPRRLRRPQRPPGRGGGPHLRQPEERRRRVAAPARPGRSPRPARSASSPMPGASSPSRWPTRRPPPSTGSRRSASPPTR